MGALTQGLVHQPIMGETACGDAYCVIERPDFTLVAVVDGLGHGPLAEAVAQAAIIEIEAQADLSPLAILEHCQAVLRGTRGVVAAVVRIEWEAGSLVHAGLGNIETRVVNADKVRRPISVNGIVGDAIRRRLREERLPFAAGDMLVMHSDGISDRFEITPAARDLDPQFLAMRIANTHGKAHDDKLLLILAAARES